MKTAAGDTTWALNCVTRCAVEVIVVVVVVVVAVEVVAVVVAAKFPAHDKQMHDPPQGERMIV